MDFDGPDATDFANVYSLNRAFLSLLVRGEAQQVCLDSMQAPLRARLTSLGRRQIERLAATPFLLLSLRERDAAYWERLLAGETIGDLFAVAEPPGDDYQRLVSAALAFVWQLSRQNPYSARLICGASMHWCETIGERTFYNLLAVAGRRRDVLVLRLAGEGKLWRKLLESGVSKNLKIRRAAHLCALQSVLTRPQAAPAEKLATAACGFRQKRLQVADDGNRRRR